METNLLKKIVGFILTLVAGWLNFETAGDMAVSIVVLFASVYAIMEGIKALDYFSGEALKIISWLIGPLLSMGLWLLQLGIFEGLPWYFGLAIGIAASVSAIFVYLTEWLEALLALFIPWFQKQQEWKAAKIIAINRLAEEKKAA